MSEQVKRYGYTHIKTDFDESPVGDYVLHSDHLASREADKAEIGRLRELVYVPGQWRCAKCNLTITRTVMSAATGQMHADHEPASCPNGCGPLWQITERDKRRDAQRSFLDQFDELAKAKARIAELEASLANHFADTGKMVSAEDEAVRRDAERYRFIRDVPWQCTPLGRVISQQRNVHWDTSIDAAIAAAKEGK